MKIDLEENNYKYLLSFRKKYIRLQYFENKTFTL